MGFILFMIVFMVLAFPATIIIELFLLLFTLLLIISDISTIKSKTLPNQKRKQEDKDVCEMVVDDTVEALEEVADVVDVAADAIVYTGATVASATNEIATGVANAVDASVETLNDDIKEL